jgi:hypothetical protein
MEVQNMSIDPCNESLIALSQVGKHLPRRRRGRKPHISCIYRWTKSGCKGVILESIQVGGTRCTSKEALARFFRRLTLGDSTVEAIHTRSHAQRERAMKKAMRELEAAGV